MAATQEQEVVTQFTLHPPELRFQGHAPLHEHVLIESLFALRRGTEPVFSPYEVCTVCSFEFYVGRGYAFAPVKLWYVDARLVDAQFVRGNPTSSGYSPEVRWGYYERDGGLQKLNDEPRYHAWEYIRGTKFETWALRFLALKRVHGSLHESMEEMRAAMPYVRSVLGADFTPES